MAKGISMSLLKFVSFAFLSLPFLGNIWAECPDLTGTYLCEDSKYGEVTFSHSVDGQGMTTYHNKRRGGTNRESEYDIVADGRNHFGVISECYKNKLVLWGRVTNYWQLFSLSGDALLINIIDKTYFDSNQVIEQKILCPRV